MIKQEKLKNKKNYNSFHRNIQEFAVNRPQKKKKEKKEKCKSFLLTSIRDINRNSYWNRF